MGYNIGPRVVLECRYDDTTGHDGIDLAQTAADNLAQFVIPFKCRVVYAGLAIHEVVAADQTAPNIRFDKRPTIGSDTGRGDGDVANITVPDTTAAGKVLYDKAGYDVELEPGNQVMVQLVTAASDSGTATGTARPFLVVDMLEETMSNLDNMVETA